MKFQPGMIQLMTQQNMPETIHLEDTEIALVFDASTGFLKDFYFPDDSHDDAEVPEIIIQILEMTMANQNADKQYH